MKFSVDGREFRIAFHYDDVPVSSNAKGATLYHNDKLKSTEEMRKFVLRRLTHFVSPILRPAMWKAYLER